MDAFQSIEYKIFKNKESLSAGDQALFELAEQQTHLAYAPYSRFYVGAAILLDNGKMVAGSNQENASYPLCMCAERVALYSAISQYPDVKATKMAIVANNKIHKTDRPIPPCGACRQVILEYESRFKVPMEILLKDDLGSYYQFKSIRTLLPLAFDGSFLIVD